MLDANKLMIILSFDTRFFEIFNGNIYNLACERVENEASSPDFITLILLHFIQVYS